MGCADQQVFLAGAAVEQGEKRRQQQLEARRTFRLGKLLQRLAQRGRQVERATGAVVPLDKRAGLVAGQVEERQRAGQLAAPELPQPLALRAVEQRPLPAHIVVVGESRCRRERVGSRRGQCSEFAAHQLERPAVAADVMQGEQQDVLAASRGVGEPVAAQRGWLRQVERRSVGGFQRGGQVRSVPGGRIACLPGGRRLRQHLLVGLTAVRREDRAQHGVAGRQRRAGGAPARHGVVGSVGDAQRQRLVVGVALRRQPPKKPERGLAVAQRADVQAVRRRGEQFDERGSVRLQFLQDAGSGGGFGRPVAETPFLQPETPAVQGELVQEFCHAVGRRRRCAVHSSPSTHASAASRSGAADGSPPSPRSRPAAATCVRMAPVSAATLSSVTKRTTGMSIQ
jgi:hypothetical protein